MIGRILCRFGLHRDEWVYVKFLDDWRWLNCYACRRCRRARWEFTGTEPFLKLLELANRPLPTNEQNYGPRRDQGAEKQEVVR